MSKDAKSKLDRFTASLDDWFGVQKLTLGEVRQKLKDDGCDVSISQLSRWWESRQSQLSEERLLAQIASGAKQCRSLQEAFAENPAPQLETIIGLHRVLIMQMSTQGIANPEMLKMADQLTRTVLEFISGQTKAKLKERELALAEGKFAYLQKEDLDKALAALHAELKELPGGEEIYQTFVRSIQEARERAQKR